MDKSFRQGWTTHGLMHISPQLVHIFRLFLRGTLGVRLGYAQTFFFLERKRFKNPKRKPTLPKTVVFGGVFIFSENVSFREEVSLKILKKLSFRKKVS